MVCATPSPALALPIARAASDPIDASLTRRTRCHAPQDRLGDYI